MVAVSFLQVGLYWPPERLHVVLKFADKLQMNLLGDVYLSILSIFENDFTIKRTEFARKRIVYLSIFDNC